jgi:hypothetical protein
MGIGQNDPAWMEPSASGIAVVIQSFSLAGSHKGAPGAENPRLVKIPLSRGRVADAHVQAVRGQRHRRMFSSMLFVTRFLRDTP